MQFEVNKKYTRDGNIMRVLFLTEKSALVTYEHLVKDSSFIKVGQELLWKRNEVEISWKEYKEPVIRTATYSVQPTASKEKPELWLSSVDYSVSTSMGKFRVTTEGTKLKSVEIIE